MKPLWSYGFRPFFLLAAAFAATSVIVWVLVLRGAVALPPGLPPFSWHAHEMLFGFTSAVLAGFLLTAVRNWTGGQPTLEGRGLIVLVVIWLAGRVLALLPIAVPAAVHALVDAAFFVGLAVSIGIPLVRTRNKRNLAMPPLLLLLGGADVAMHVGAAGGGPLWIPLATTFALYVPLLFVVIVGGRVIPFFTQNALRGEGVVVSDLRVVAYAGLVTVALVVLAEILVVVAPSTAPLAAAAHATASVLLFARMRGWATFKTFSRPVLAVLHVGWASLALGFLLMGLARKMPSLILPTTALHALTVGGLAVIILGMMSRVSLGHTGRPIVVVKPIVVAYGLVVLAALVRVAVPALAPSTSVPFLDIAAGLFAAAFVIFFFVYLPILLAPRPDEEGAKVGRSLLDLKPARRS